ncbi:hypothetical protein [Nonomuraea sp. NPDC052265]|uniref:hypothetical protein n=1 Tax=Nonomuraea sp. NPDC052265 TaxID=3364374 RepID=UPI0037CB31EA
MPCARWSGAITRHAGVSPARATPALVNGAHAFPLLAQIPPGSLDLDGIASFTT